MTKRNLIWNVPARLIQILWNRCMYGDCTAYKKEFANAEKQYLKAIQLDTTLTNGLINLGNLYLKAKRYAEAETQFNKAAQLQPGNPRIRYKIACIHSLQGQTNKAFESLERLLSGGWKHFDLMHEDPDLAQLRDHPEWKAMMKKHFPDKVKD